MSGCEHEKPLPHASDRIVVALDAAPGNLDPRFATDASSMRISRLIFQSLVSVDNEDLAPKPELATRWAQDEDDPAIWLITLRKDARWHDGTPLTAQDVVYTYRSVMDPAVGSPFRDPYQAHFKQIQAVSSHTVRIELRAPYATFLTDLVLGIVPSHVLAGTGDRFLPDQYVGSGPYRFRARQGDRRLDLEAVTAKGEGAKHLIFRTIRDEGTRLIALLGGSIDIAQNSFSPVLANVIGARPELVVDSQPSIAFTYVALNMKHMALADDRVRRALAYAIPRQRIINTHLLGRADLASGMLAPMHWAYESDDSKYEYDPEYARELLRKAGYGPEGKHLSIQIKISTDRFRRTLARTIAAAWKEVGVHATVRSYEFGTFFADIKNGHFEAYLLDLPEPMEPDMYRWMLYSLGTPQKKPTGGSRYARYDRRYLPPELLSLSPRRDADCADYRGLALRNGMRNWVHRAFGISPPYSTANRMYYANPRVDCHLELALEPSDRKERIPHYSEVQRILANDLPVIPLWHPHVQVTRRANVVGFEPLPNLRLANLVTTRLKRQPTKP